MSLIALVIEVHDVLEAASLPHAFGGALALAYAAEPRGTVDIDVNVFSPADDADAVLAVLESIDLRPEQAGDRVPMAGIRLRRPADPSPVDVFLSLDGNYVAVERRLVLHPFGPGATVLPFLSPEDLATFKLSFGRDKDWVDLRAMARSRPPLDLAYIEHQLISLRGPTMHPRIARLRALVRDEAGGA